MAPVICGPIPIPHSAFRIPHSVQLARGIALENLMGSRIEAFKLVSSLTLSRAARSAAPATIRRATDKQRTAAIVSIDALLGL